MKEKSLYAICPECQDNMQIRKIGQDLRLECYHYSYCCGNSTTMINGCDICFCPVIINLTFSDSACSNPACPYYRVDKWDDTILVRHNGFTAFETLKYDDKLHIAVFTTETSGKPEVLQFFKKLFLDIIEAHGVSLLPYLDLPVKEISIRNKYA